MGRPLPDPEQTSRPLVGLVNVQTGCEIYDFGRFLCVEGLLDPKILAVDFDFSRNGNRPTLVGLQILDLLC